MRPEHLLNHGYTPTSVEALEQIADLLLPMENAGGVIRLLDPTCGGGEALAFLADSLKEQGARVETYGVEIAPSRFHTAKKHLDHVLLADVTTNVTMSVNAFSLVLLNPPYDNTGGEESVERRVIIRGLRALRPGGVAVIVVPQRLLKWLGRFHMEWLSLFQTHDPDSPNQVVLIGRRDRGTTPLPAMGTKTKAVVPPSTLSKVVFRVSVVLDRHIATFASDLKWPEQMLYGSGQQHHLTALHPVGAGHKAMLLIANKATVRIGDTYIRVTAEPVTTTKVVFEDGTKKLVVTQRPEVKAYRLTNDALEKIPLGTLSEYADEIAQAINLQTYVREQRGGDGLPMLAPWEQRVLDQINARLPRLGDHQGLFPAQATRAVAMARALLAGEKTVFGLMEMGYGKTPISLSTLALLRARRRVDLAVVMCPPHLVEKWGREAKRLHPDATVVLPKGNGERRMREVRKALALAKKKFVVVILSREAMKLGPTHKVQLIPKVMDLGEGPKKYWVCPHCYTPAVTSPVEINVAGEVIEAPTWVSLEDSPAPPPRFKGKKCPECGMPYAAPVNEKKSRRWPLADVIAREVKRQGIRMAVLVDEVHEYRNRSLQGIAFSRLMRVSRWAVLLTGTLFNGKASDLYNLLMWTSPEFRAEGMSKRNFVEKYGYSQAVRTITDTRTYGRTGLVKFQFHEMPGVSPLVYRFLFPRTAFGSLRDVAQALPAYTEREHLLEGAIKEFSPEEGGQVFHHQGPAAFMAWMRAALGYNNAAAVRPPDGGHVHTYGYWESNEDGERLRFQNVLTLPVLPAEHLLPKEKHLIELAREQKARGRKMVLLVEQTTKRPLAGRLVNLLNNAGIRAVELDTARVKASKREEWVEKNAPLVDVLVAHPKAVETGLDLVMFQTAIVYEATYNIISLLQALRRIHRLGQTKDVEVHILQYAGTLEPTAWDVIHRGVAWAVSVYGDFLAEIDPNLSLLSALAEQLKTGEPVDTSKAAKVTLSGFNADEVTKRHQPVSGESETPAPQPTPTPVPVPVQAGLASLPLFAALAGGDNGSNGHSPSSSEPPSQWWERVTQGKVEQLALF